MSLLAPIVFIVALVGAIVCLAKALFHNFGMIRGVCTRAEVVNLIPFIALALPGALDAAGQVHRAKFVFWLSLGAVFAIVAAVVQFLFGP
jgi:hypothetical protein